ncbi:hypothetical protein [Candidatus Magnetominusculus dajiuhuensis]|uniref:hypothetical protein n=1 Tax=Candidatus Magnetominusculus dajiuhuensis TaxID=3137712 RepID=UPI003B4317C2
MKELTQYEMKHRTKPTKVDGFTTEATYREIQRSIVAHGLDDIKIRISRERTERGEKLSYRERSPDNLNKRGKTYIALTREDFQNIMAYRTAAVESGTVEYRPKSGKRQLEAFLFKTRQKDVVTPDGVTIKGGLINIIYEIFPAEKKLVFKTMWKEQ